MNGKLKIPAPKAEENKVKTELLMPPFSMGVKLREKKFFSFCILTF